MDLKRGCERHWEDGKDANATGEKSAGLGGHNRKQGKGGPRNESKL